MPSHDLFHFSVKQALIKDGWTITDDPLSIPFGLTEVYIDLAAEKIIAASKDGQLIAVEIKSFLRPSVLTDFHAALGQFLNYRVALEQYDNRRELFLAIPADTHRIFFSQPIVQKILQRYQVNMLVYLSETEEIQEWIKW
ncbi:MAG: XisH family protein [Deinococcales bacterium]